ncbi:ABC transporter permease [Pontibacter sp. G13]|uniref:MlaE family ABC transporter permease n=1 Tax=Pontibacter sp. G13 TaxID=3074898 RepID=UPI00288BFFA4|nr:ABC transporter permease [Pontibacter sp. G13]WNJ18763.1 ABC transporter permease [Pontibacter sp. G13]
MDKFSIYYRLFVSEVVTMIQGSLVIVTVISVFIGAVSTLQTAYQLTTSLVPKSIIGTIVSTTTLLELSPTVLTFILAGRIGSKIASEIGTMRVTEQIDALEVMGVNSSAYLILPKLIAGLLAVPVLVTASAFLAHAGGLIAGDLTGSVTVTEFTMGAQTYYDPYQVVVMYVKAFTFGFLITSVSAYQGYFTHGGALEVGASATKAVVYSCLSIVTFDYLIAQIML